MEKQIGYFTNRIGDWTGQETKLKLIKWGFDIWIAESQHGGYPHKAEKLPTRMMSFLCYCLLFDIYIKWAMGWLWLEERDTERERETETEQRGACGLMSTSQFDEFSPLQIVYHHHLQILMWVTGDPTLFFTLHFTTSFHDPN